jgi:uncharacterized cupin superfamily protein
VPQEARLEQNESGLAPAEAGWFVVNVADAAWYDHPNLGAMTVFESKGARFEGLGINVQVLLPGQPNGMYHSEAIQEDFLVLAGECLLLVEEQERRLKQWDFVHCPPGTRHIFVGAGDGPCAILMTSPREPGHAINYPVSELALRHGAGVEVETDKPPEAYANQPEERRARPACWNELPWARP